MFVIINVMILIIGVFVAGLDVGLIYNSWFKMVDRWIFSDFFVFLFIWKNFFENLIIV